MPKAHTVRIISGQWRGRRLPVLDRETLRPTKDIIRETVFNWLEPILPGSRCLDAFAGTGALGFEAASRGAAEVVLLETDRRVQQQLQQQLALFAAKQMRLELMAAERYLQQAANAKFDIVFLDPPFAANMLASVCDLLACGKWLGTVGRVYLEAAKQEGLPELPNNWELVRRKTSGDVVYGLAVVK